MLFFDPENFFHNADKPNKLRIMLYIVVVKKNNYILNKTKNIKIKKKHNKNFTESQKRFSKFLSKV